MPDFCQNQHVSRHEEIINGLADSSYFLANHIKFLHRLDCCNAKAEFVYNISRIAEQITNNIKANVPDNFSEFFEEAFENISASLNEVFISVSDLFQSQSPFPCVSILLEDHFGKIEEEFNGIAAHLSEATGEELQSYSQWADFSANCLNDCDYMPYLYKKAFLHISALLKELRKNCHSAKDIREFISWNKIKTALCAISDSLNEINTISLKNNNENRVLCKYCKIEEISHFLELIGSEINYTANYIKAVVEACNSLESSTDSIITNICQFFGFENLSTFNKNSVPLLGKIEILDEVLSTLKNKAEETNAAAQVAYDNLYIKNKPII
jgi:methyl-accepting chemotaxis protein